jgi:protein gp37
MGRTTRIEYADHSASPWYGCSRVHTGCLNCYAEAIEKRRGIDRSKHRVLSVSFDHDCRAWDRAAAHQGVRRRVLLQLCDPFEETDLPVVYGGLKKGLPCFERLYLARFDMFATIDACQWLDFLLFTKRPENIKRFWPPTSDPGARLQEQGLSADYRSNVWLGTSISDQATADRMVPELLKCRDLAPVLALSIEPLLGPIEQNMIPWMELDFPVGWVIVGGESGPGFRPCEIEWIESIVDHCQAAGVPCFVKQDCGRKSGQQGRIPDRLWKIKELPR